MNPLGFRARVATLSRLFLVQASFNYRTMIGSGLAFCLVPILRRLHADDPARFDEAMARHTGMFNAHPYLAGLAVGAVARMEVEGAEPVAVERFKVAVRGPLGSVGDQLIWATWLPGVALVSGGLGLMRLDPVYAVLGFLLLYNVGHLALRFWGLSAGLSAGPLVAAQIREARLPEWTTRSSYVLAVGIGLMLGGLAAMAGAAGQQSVLWWGVPTLVGFGLGARGGAQVWRVAVTGFSSVVLGLAIAGVVL